MTPGAQITAGGAVNAVDTAAVAAFPEIAMLLVLRDAGWTFLPRGSDPDQLDGFRTWDDGWCDAIRVRSGSDVRAVRTNPDDHLVWIRTGTLVDVVTELLVLPVPDDSTAPRLVIGSSPDR
ncbi:hypothetical protein [Umezawaea sp. NPDC059074]|uniref:hypothetical protein n=1 Tax=Umezawaea sp. NPDC059074 TaxID=3346716 RepID=UPI00368E30DF